MRLIDIFESIKESYCNIWSFKEHGEVLEVITPFSTTTNKFVSVFLKQEGASIVVTDGGWIFDGEYQAEPDIDDNIYLKSFYYFQNHYGIREKEEFGGRFFYKFTDEMDLVPNLIHDLSNFIVSIVDITQIDFLDRKESVDRKMFSSTVNAFLESIIPDGYLIKNKTIGEHIKDVQFNAIVTVNKKLNLVKYITGTNITNLRNSISRAANDFYAVNRSVYKPNIKNMVSIINDSSAAYRPGEVYTYLDNLTSISGIEPIIWSQKERVLQYLN